MRHFHSWRISGCIARSIVAEKLRRRRRGELRRTGRTGRLGPIDRGRGSGRRGRSEKEDRGPRLECIHHPCAHECILDVSLHVYLPSIWLTIGIHQQNPSMTPVCAGMRRCCLSCDNQAGPGKGKQYLTSLIATTLPYLNDRQPFTGHSGLRDEVSCPFFLCFT